MPVTEMVHAVRASVRVRLALTRANWFGKVVELK
jgi:hypothetical protein